MKNTKKAVIYGVSGAALGYGVARYAKLGKKEMLYLVIGLGILGAFVGNNN